MTRSTRAATAALLFFAAILPAPAQPSLERPRTSPHATVTQTIGVTEVKVEYHRPGVKGREIWGALVPYGQVWRTGANEVTTVTFADPVSVEGYPLAAGSYGLFTLPRKDAWTVIFSSNTGVWGTDYDSTKDVLRVETKPRSSDHVEWMQFGFAGLSDTAATLELRWESLTVPVRLGVRTTDVVLGKARKEFEAGPDTGRPGMLRQAAGYALAQGAALDEALSWIDRSLAVRKTLPSYGVKSDILARKGDAAAAAAALDDGIAAAKPEDASEYALSLRRDGRAPRAVEMLEAYAAKHGRSYAVDRALGESYDAAGDRTKAHASLEAAASSAPGEKEKQEVQGLIKTINEKN